MRSPEAVLKSLKSHSESPRYQYERLYRNLFNPAFYLLEYQQTYSKHHGFKTVYLYDYGFKKQPIITIHASKNQSKELLTRFRD